MNNGMDFNQADQSLYEKYPELLDLLIDLNLKSHFFLEEAEVKKSIDHMTTSNQLKRMW